MKSLSTEKQKGIVAIFILALVWGLLPLIPRFLNIHFQLFQQVYLRMFVGLLFSLLFFSKQIRFKRILQISVRDFALIFFRATTYFVLGVVLNTQAILLTKISNVTLIGTIPFTAILGFLLLREKVTVKKIALVILSFLGALIVAIKTSSHFSVGMGELFALLSALSTSFALISRKWQSKFLNDQETSTLVLFFAAIEISIISFFMKEGLPIHNWTLSTIIFLAIAGILNTATSYFFNYGMARVDAVLSGNILMLEPVLASFFAFLVFREFPVGREVVGGVIIIVSVVFMHRLEGRTSKEK